IPAPATAAPSATPSASTPASTESEKFITLFPLAYKGIPLSKGSDYLSVVDGNGRILATRKRGLPSKVDATQATVTETDAINAARQSAGSAFSSIDPGKVRGELQVWVDNQQNGNLAWSFVLDSGSVTDPDVRRYWVSAVGQPRVLD